MSGTLLPNSVHFKCGVRRRIMDNVKEPPNDFKLGSKLEPVDTENMNQSQKLQQRQQDIKFIWPSKVFLNLSWLSGDHMDLDINQVSRTTMTNPETANEIHYLNKIKNSFNQFQAKTKDSISIKAYMSDVWKTKRYPHTCEKSIATHNAMKELCFTCVEDGEKIARIHCYRPFIKKIDGLCDRIKQELIFHDSVVPHVKFHGIIWTMKDLVFISIRIINAWNIIKGYVYDPSEGLNKVRMILSLEFVPSFVGWQEATLKFLENLMKSFLSLDIWIHYSNNTIKRMKLLRKLNAFMRNMLKQAKVLQGQRKNNNTYWKQYGCGLCEDVLTSQATHDILLQLSIICCEHGIKIAQNYNIYPFFNKIDSLCSRTRADLIHCDNAVVSNLNSQGMVWAVKELIFATTRIITSWNISKGYVYDSSDVLDKVRVCLSKQFVESFDKWQEASMTFVENLRFSFLKLNDFVHVENNYCKSRDLFKHTQTFKQQLQQLKSTDVFFKTIFCRNYFPDFIAKIPAFVEIHWIFCKLQSGGHGNIFEIVHDVKFIIYQVKVYLLGNIDPNLDWAVRNFQDDVNKILESTGFDNYTFDYIEGQPCKNICLHNNYLQ